MFVLHGEVYDDKSVCNAKRRKKKEKLSLGHESQLEMFNKSGQTHRIAKELQLSHFSNLFTAGGSCTVFTFIVKLVKYGSGYARVYARIYVRPPNAFIIFKLHWRQRFPPSFAAW